VQINALVLERAPPPLDEDVVKEPALAVHRDANAHPSQPVGPREGCELAALVGVHDLRAAELVNRLIQCLDTEVSFQRIGDTLGQHLAGKPVDDCDQIEEPAAHLQIGDVPSPDMVWTIHAQPLQQIRPDFVPLRRS
jgi:hypothetical protein